MFNFLSKSTEKDLSDADLIKNYKSSENPAYVAELFRRYMPLLATIAYSYFGKSPLGEDAIMEVYEIIAADLKSHDVQNFKPWLYSVSKNHFLKVKKKEGVYDLFDNDMMKSQDLFVENGEELSLKLENEELLNKLEGSLSELNDEQQVCVTLFYLKGKSYKEVADETGFELSKVKSHIQNGKRNLKLILEKTNG